MPSVQPRRALKDFFDRASGFFGKNVLEICKSADIVFNALHGDEGEKRQIAGSVRPLNICYTGSGAQGCMLAMNKSLSKQLFRTHGIPTPEAVILFRIGQMPRSRALRKARFALRCEARKPRLQVSAFQSSGRTMNFSPRWIRLSALKTPLSLKNTSKGAKFAVGIVGSRVLPAIEIIPKHGFYDYKNKYQPGCTVEICPADIDSDTAERMAEATRKSLPVFSVSAHMHGPTFMVDENGIYCLEANTLPGMTPVSLLPQEAAADKLDFPALLEAIIRKACF